MLQGVLLQESLKHLTSGEKKRKISHVAIVKNYKDLARMNVNLQGALTFFFFFLFIWIIKMSNATPLSSLSFSLPLLRLWMAGFTSTWKTIWLRSVTLSWKRLKQHTTPSSSCWTNPPEWVRCDKGHKPCFIFILWKNELDDDNLDHYTYNYVWQILQ